MLRADSFAVVDCETTGLHPSTHHRIIELAVVGLNEDWEPDDIWCTLLCPERDLGPTDVHGIRGRDVHDAPSFDDVPRFDTIFLEAELTRLGIDVAPLPSLCTMRLAGSLGIGGGRRRLTDCCAAIGVPTPEGHTARGDAVACAALLAACVRAGDIAAIEESIAGTPRLDWPTSNHRAPCRTRETPRDAVAEPSFLAKLVHKSEVPSGMDAALVAPYLDVLDRAIEDRWLSPAEQSELTEVAMTLGLTSDRVRKLHSDYMATLVALARRDGVVTDRERADLILVAEALGIAEIENLLDRPFDQSTATLDSASELKGQSVCFTGALTCCHEGRVVTRDLAQELAEQAGMTVAPRVTKKLDVLVVADPNSLSGKARKAREYGTRIVAETAFWSMIGVEVS